MGLHPMSATFVSLVSQVTDISPVDPATGRFGAAQVTLEVDRGGRGTEQVAFIIDGVGSPYVKVMPQVGDLLMVQGPLHDVTEQDGVFVLDMPCPQVRVLGQRSRTSVTEA